MHKASDFVAWAVARAKPESVPTGAVIPFSVGVAKTGPWEYLFGTTGGGRGNTSAPQLQV